MVHERFTRHHRLFSVSTIIFGRARRAPEEAG
jgi:hypothetical protein